MTRTSILLSAMLCVPLLSACVSHHHRGHHGRSGPAPVVVGRGGPPPHAPAHGYRHKHRHHGVDLVFDARLGVYVVVGLDGVYFHADHFYRPFEGGWQVSLEPDRAWSHAEPAKLPPGLAKMSVHQERRGRGRGPHPARHRH